jgi:hypothetical protein
MSGILPAPPSAEGAILLNHELVAVERPAKAGARHSMPRIRMIPMKSSGSNQWRERCDTKCRRISSHLARRPRAQRDEHARLPEIALVLRISYSRIS